MWIFRIFSISLRRFIILLSIIQMFYCLIKNGSEYEIEDRLNVRGPKLPWGPVTVKRGKTWKDGHAAIFVSGGDMKEMEMEKEKYETGELKPPRSNTKRKPLVSHCMQ